MYLSLDFGGSTVDAVLWKTVELMNPVLKERNPLIQSYERSKVSTTQLDSFFKTSGLSLDGIERIFVTGGKSRFFPSHFMDLPIIKVPEIKAIGRGGLCLFQNDPSFKDFSHINNLLVVSMGTGTCIVETKIHEGKFLSATHVGGMGVGGGTFLGLSRALLGEVDIQKLMKLFQRGDLSKVDISVHDIIGSGIGRVPSSATASNLGRLSNEVDFSPADLASGIVHLIGQTIGMIATFAAQSRGISVVLLTGKLTRVEQILDVIIKTAKIYGIEMFVPENAAYVSAFGAVED